MINLLIILIIIICLSFYINKIERFNTDSTDYKLGKCNFLPWGPTLNKCIETCNDIKYQEIINGKGFCDKNTCIEICNKCTDTERCQWLLIKQNEEKETESLEQNIYETFKLEEESRDENTITIKWEQLDNITSYKIYFKQYYNNNIFNINIIDTKNNNHTFNLGKEIDKNSTYRVMVYGQYNYGIGAKSNTILLKT